MIDNFEPTTVQAKKNIPDDDWRGCETPGCSLSNKALTCTKDKTSGHATFMGSKGWKTGVHNFAVRIDNGGNDLHPGWAMIGCAGEGAKNRGGRLNNYSTQGYFFWAARGTIWCREAKDVPLEPPPEPSWENGTVIHVCLDCDHHTLSFGVNDGPMRLAFTHLPADEWFPAVEIYYPNTVVSFLQPSRSEIEAKLEAKKACESLVQQNEIMLNKMRDERNQLLQEKESQAAEIEKLSKELTIQREACNSWRQRNLEVFAGLKERDQDLEKLRLDVQRTVSAGLKERDQDLEKLRIDLRRTEEARDQILKQLHAKMEDCNAAAAERDLWLQRNVEKEAEMLANLNRHRSEMQKEMQKYETEIEQHKKEKETLTTQLDAMKTERNAYIDFYGVSKHTVSMLEAEVESQKSKLEAKLASLETEKASLETEKASLETEKASLETEKFRAEAEKVAIKAELESRTKDQMADTMKTALLLAGFAGVCGLVAGRMSAQHATNREEEEDY